jgi:hypothetical protein
MHNRKLIISSINFSKISLTPTYYILFSQGKLLGENDTSFGSFVRCGYPKLTASGDLEIVNDCGRYSR